MLLTITCELFGVFLKSRGIIDWAKDPNRGIGPFSSEHMETTCFIDLTARLGQPYVYVHQGECEHIIILSDLRFVVERW